MIPYTRNLALTIAYAFSANETRNVIIVITVITVKSTTMSTDLM